MAKSEQLHVMIPKESMDRLRAMAEKSYRKPGNQVALLIDEAWARMELDTVDGFVPEGWTEEQMDAELRR